MAAASPKTEFSAGVLRELIMHAQCPEMLQLLAQDKAASPRTLTWLAASDAWDAQHPGLSESSCKKLCDALVTEGLLSKRQEVRGWYKQNWYRPVSQQNTREAAPAPLLTAGPE